MPGGSWSSTARTSTARSRVTNQASTPASLKSNVLEAGSSPYAPIDLTDSAPSQARKRKLPTEYTSPQPKRTLAEALQSPPSTKKRKPKKEPEEKRCRRFRDHPPQSFHDVYERAMSQRFFVLERERTGTEECPGEKVELTGSTGNIYTVHVDMRPTCDCPHAAKGNQCKHTIFVLKKVLNAPYQHVYQLGLLSSELREIFARAPPIEPTAADVDDDGNGKRKPIEGDCPICYSELGETKESIVWCRAACGQNMHQECFETWARTRGAGGKVTCPMCRSVWEGDGMQTGKVEKGRGTVSEGYVNVADQLGISQVRDTSSYSEWFGRSSGGFYGGGRGSRGGRRGGWRSYW